MHENKEIINSNNSDGIYGIVNVKTTQLLQTNTHVLHAIP